jgi:hypothetical protein
LFSLHAYHTKIGRVSKLSDQVSVRIDPEWRDVLRTIEEKHRIPPPEFIRGLVAAGLEFYRNHGWFAFPIHVQPGDDYVDAVAETRAHYGAKSPKKKPSPPATPPPEPGA